MRRKLRLPSSSDEDDDHQTLQTLISRNPPNPNPSSANPNPPLEISDDDFVDASDVISPPSSSPPAARNSSDPVLPVDDFLRNLGLRLRRQWLDSCISGLSTSHPGFAGLDVAGKAKLCFSQFLFSDMNFSGSGVLPADVHTMHGVELAGPFLLQVDEIVNISVPLRERYHDASAGLKRCLKLSMTDGAQRVVGMEYRPVSCLEALAPAGLKVCIRNVHIRRGLLMLVPEVLEVLGGLVEELDAARQRLVQEVNKPPRGKRRRNGEVPSLVTRARHAAWPTNIANDAQVNTSLSSGANLSHHLGQVASLTTPVTDVIGRTREGLATSNSGLDAEANMTSSNAAVTLSASPADAGEINIGSFAAPSNAPDAHLSSSNTMLSVATMAFPCDDAGGKIMEVCAPTRQRPNAEDNCASSTASNVEYMATSGNGAGERAREGFPSPVIGLRSYNIPLLDTALDEGTLDTPSSDTEGASGKGLPASSNRLDVEANPSASDLDANENHKVEEVEHPLILSGDKEIPFTYLACLLAKWTASKDPVPVVLGKIKGTMLVEISKRSPLPVALEMSQGCPPSDAWMLLRRLRVLTAPQTPKRIHSSPINISP
ncbi:hypothetical protein MRB53_027498 [Persea americana]|uniref:Uncharacterized protein n=1 Tax=Persea americana TaxID=3435 RepID=A0ACC2LL86_PERAE|nr:hypothetical protein MRB53_027498 [Persea americana]